MIGYNFPSQAPNASNFKLSLQMTLKSMTLLTRRLELPLLRPDPFNTLILCRTIEAISAIKFNWSHYEISLQWSH